MKRFTRGGLGLAVLGAAALVAAVGTPVPSGAAPPADIEVLESTGIAAVGGVITRVPAESPGGAVFATTTINLDKARGTAAGFTAGNLVEIFFGTSSEDYRNPSLVNSQYPPTKNAPAEATAEHGEDGTSGASGLYTTRSTEQPAATASATVKTVVWNRLSITGGRSASSSVVGPDGVVLTETRAESAAIVIGDVVDMRNVTSVATARIGADGTPEATINTAVGSISVNDVPARLSERGLELSDQQPVTPRELAAFNAGLAQLQERGITVAAVPATVVEEPGRARAAGAVAVLRYQIPSGPIPNSIGNDEEFLLGQVVAESIAGRRPPEGPLPSLDLPAEPATVGPIPPVPGPAVATPAPEVRPAPTLLSDPVGAGTEFTLAAGGPFGVPAPASSAGTAPDANHAAGDAPSNAAGPPDGELALTGLARATPADRLRAGYAIFILAALGGAGLFIARQRTGLA